MHISIFTIYTINSHLIVFSLIHYDFFSLFLFFLPFSPFFNLMPCPNLPKSFWSFLTKFWVLQDGYISNEEKKFQIIMAPFFHLFACSMVVFILQNCVWLKRHYLENWLPGNNCLNLLTPSFLAFIYILWKNSVVLVCVAKNQH